MTVLANCSSSTTLKASHVSRLVAKISKVDFYTIKQASNYFYTREPAKQVIITNYHYKLLY